MVLYQISKVQPPGYGGVERVAYLIWLSVGGQCLSFSSSPSSISNPSFHKANKLLAPFSSRSNSCSFLDFLLLIKPSDKILLHFPSPATLFLGFFLLFHPCRPQTYVFWHAYVALTPNLKGILSFIYERLAFIFLPTSFHVIFTSTSLLQSAPTYLNRRRTSILPLSIPFDLENRLLAIPLRNSTHTSTLNILYLGRLDTYKRLDLVFKSLALLDDSSFHFHIAGNGPLRIHYAKQASLSLPSHSYTFYGRVDEDKKYELLKLSSCFILPSVICNEAFGIVQLEAMASGLPSFAFDIPRSGAGTICILPSLQWDHKPATLHILLQQLIDTPSLISTLSAESRSHYLQQYSNSAWTHRCNELFLP